MIFDTGVIFVKKDKYLVTSLQWLDLMLGITSSLVTIETLSHQTFIYQNICKGCFNPFAAEFSPKMPFFTVKSFFWL